MLTSESLAAFTYGHMSLPAFSTVGHPLIHFPDGKESFQCISTQTSKTRERMLYKERHRSTWTKGTLGCAEPIVTLFAVFVTLPSLLLEFYHFKDEFNF